MELSVNPKNEWTGYDSSPKWIRQLMAIFCRSSVIGAKSTPSNISAVAERKSRRGWQRQWYCWPLRCEEGTKSYPVPMNHLWRRCGVGKGQWTKIGCAGFVAWDGGNNNGVCGAGQAGGKWCYSPTMQLVRKRNGVYLFIGETSFWISENLSLRQFCSLQNKQNSSTMV